MLKIRLKRGGRKKSPFYRVVLANSTSRRDGASIAELGFYDPMQKKVRLDLAGYDAWVKKGATPTETVAWLHKVVTAVAEAQGAEVAQAVIELPKKERKEHSTPKAEVAVEAEVPTSEEA
ncbi:MAG: 30S ribosomal protein S16 [Vampirovibrionales bacterium]